MSRFKKIPIPVLVLGLAAAVTVTSAMTQQRDLPESFEQIIPRGRIAAIDDPQFVHAAEASIADDSVVLGVVIDGQARAYSIRLLNTHEVVNDAIGETNFAAVW